LHPASRLNRCRQGLSTLISNNKMKLKIPSFLPGEFKAPTHFPLPLAVDSANRYVIVDAFPGVEQYSSAEGHDRALVRHQESYIISL